MREFSRVVSYIGNGLLELCFGFVQMAHFLINGTEIIVGFC